MKVVLLVPPTQHCNSRSKVEQMTYHYMKIGCWANCRTHLSAPIALVNFLVVSSIYEVPKSALRRLLHLKILQMLPQAQLFHQREGLDKAYKKTFVLILLLKVQILLY